MSNFTAADVKKLREVTGAGMMDCKKALQEAEGDHDKAIEVLRIKGLKSLAKREGRSASNGLVAAHTEAGLGVLVELNCETDFVAKGDRFKALGDVFLQAAVDSKAGSAEELLSAEASDGKKVAEVLDEASATIGEKLVLNRVSRLEAPVVVSYLHRTMPDLPPQIGVLLGTQADAGEDGHGVAMHIAAMAPTVLTHDQIAPELVEKEKQIIEDNAREEGKPEAAMKNIIEGRLRNFYAEHALLDQGYAKEPKVKVGDVLKQAGAEATGFIRFRVGA